MGRRAHTLLELIVSLSITTVIVGGVSSTLLLASKALPDKNNVHTNVLTAARVLSDIQQELFTAKSFISRTTTGIAFVVPDQNNDLMDESIAYQWSGIAGDPLVKTYGAGAPINVIDSVYDFSTAYILRTTTDQTTSPPVVGSETALFDHSTGSNLALRRVQTGAETAQCFQPSLPADATEWSVTRVSLRLAAPMGNVDDLWVQIRRDGGTLSPAASAVDSYTIPLSTLLSIPTWSDATFSNATGLPVIEGACVVIGTFGTNSADLEYQASGAVVPNGAFLIGNGSMWTEGVGMAMRCVVYGTVTTKGTQVTLTRYFVEGVELAVQPAATSTSRMETSVPVLNNPEVLGP